MVSQVSLSDLIPPERTEDVVLIDPTDPTHAVGFNPFVGSGDPSLVGSELSCAMVRSSGWLS